MMFRLLALLLCFVLSPLLHLSEPVSGDEYHVIEGILRNENCHSYDKVTNSSFDLGGDYHLEYRNRAILREGNLPEMDSCESLTVSGLQYIESGGFKGLENITTLIIRQDFSDIIESGMFKYLDNLENLVIGGNYNKIFKLEDEAFDNLKNLVTLTLSNNSISDIQPDVFKGLETVRDLDLSYNELQKLGPYSFGHLLSLNNISLRNNKLTRVSYTAFYNLTNLQEIDLRDNLIKAIEEPLFGIDEIIVAINLNGNPLRCDCRMEWISSWLISAKQCYGQCHAPEDMENFSLSDVYTGHAGTRGLLQCYANNSVINQTEGTLLELQCTGVDCTWTTPDGILLSEHGERQEPYFLTNYDALVIDTMKHSINGQYTCSWEGGSQTGEISVGGPDWLLIALVIACSAHVLIPLIYIVAKLDKKYKVKWKRCWENEEKRPLVPQVSSHSSGSRNISQNSSYEDEKFKKSPSFLKAIDANYDRSRSHNSDSEKEY